MRPETFVMLIRAMDAILDDEAEADERNGYVYENLSTDMANAAKLVYESCIKGQVFAAQQGE